MGGTVGSISAQASGPDPLMPGLFTSAGIPWLDTEVWSLNPSNSSYIKVVDLIFFLSGGAALAYGLYKGSLAADIAGAVLILMGILGVAIGWD